jgi:glyoxylase-like metal-dependent hydrolase (beta-lactamase superfamily II)
MIDTGCAYTVSELLNATEGLALTDIVNTHTHEDHIGANAALRRRSDATIHVHSSGIPILAEPREKKHLRPYQRVMWGYPEPSRGIPIGGEIKTGKHRFRIIHTPGHSPDHICLYEPERGWLFTGDTYIGGKDRALRADYNIWAIIASLKTLAALETTLLFSGSGSIRRNPRTVLRRKVEYYEEIADRIRALHGRGWGYGRIRHRLFGREIPLAYVTLGNFSGKNLVRSFVEDRPDDEPDDE